MDRIISDEADILSRNYSSLRTNTKKWKLFTKLETTSDKITVKNDHGYQVFVISRNFMSVDGYRNNFLYKRGLLRRNPGLFAVIYSLWEIISPFGLQGISEKVYNKFYQTVYKIIIKDNYDEKLIGKLISIDKKIDFAGKIFISLSDFYDGFFEFLDSYTNSWLSTEYIHLVKLLTASIQDKKWATGINLYSKLHIQPETKPQLHSWMTHLLQDSKLKRPEQVPSLIRIPNEIKVSQRLLIKKPSKPIDRESFNIKKLESMMHMRLLREYKQQSRCPTQSQTRIKFHDKKQITFYSNYLDKISPLSSIIKENRSKSNLLEKVIDGRKTASFKSYSHKDLFI